MENDSDNELIDEASDVMGDADQGEDDVMGDADQGEGDVMETDE
jgi:hypothetical protein